jgi:GntR family transcriptional regulator
VAEWSGEPAYKQVAEDLRGRIRDGRLLSGGQLPSLSEMMREYGVSITVVRMALSELRNEGLVATHQGKGAFVRTDIDPEAKRSQSVSDPQIGVILDELKAVRDEVRLLTERVDQLEVQGGRDNTS